MSRVIESIALYFREGTSDKVYNCTIEEAVGGHVVNFSYGRRGNALTTGSKTSSPVPLAKARQTFEKLVKEKTGKGYKVWGICPDGIPTVAQPLNSTLEPPITPTTSRCVLLNQIDAEKTEELIEDYDWIMQEKIDGVRFMLEQKDGVLRGYNRTGKEVSVPKQISSSLKSLSCDFLVDGELIGDNYHVFDIVSLAGESLEKEPFIKRFKVLFSELFCWPRITNIHLVKTADGKEDKQLLFKKIVESKGEGVVFKKKLASYRVGRPASGGDYLKFKFTADCTCLVAEINDKRSVRLSLLDGKNVVNAGNVTIPPNHKVPEVGATVDVRYLYAFKESGCLFQPVYIGERNDIYRESCTVTQLKYKPQEDDI